LADRLTLYLAKSIAWFIGESVPALDGSYVTSPSFDYDQKPDPSNPRDKVKRLLPFVGVDMMNDERTPFTVSSNILYEANIVFNIGVYGSGYSDLLNLTSDVKQALAGAAHPVSNKVGVPLYDFGVPSGTFFDLVDAVAIFDPGITNYLGPTGVEQFNNLKHRSLTPVTFSAFKDKDAELLENLGNISIND
jgi:hypothetical protein